MRKRLESRWCALFFASATMWTACGDDDAPADAGTDTSTTLDVATPTPPTPPTPPVPPPGADGGAPDFDGAMTPPPPPPPTSPPPPPTDAGPADALEAFCMRGAMIECAGNQRCCAMPMASVDACVASRAAACRDGLAGLLASEGLHIDTTRTDAFFAFVEAATTRCGGPAPDIGLLPFAGTAGVGGDCTQTTPEDLALFQCAEGLACAIDFVGRRGVCAPAPGDGGACTSPYACPIDRYCTTDFSMSTTPGLCAARLGDGSPCTRPEECAGGACTEGTCALLPDDFCFM